MNIYNYSIYWNTNVKNQFFLISLIFLSCTHKEYVYEYKGEKVKRVDTDGKSTFYYKGGVIFSKYSGINDGFQATLHFSKKNKMTIFISDGFFEKEKFDPFFNYEYIQDRVLSVGDSINTYQIYFPQEYEVNYNKNSKSKVKVTVLD